MTNSITGNNDHLLTYFQRLLEKAKEIRNFVFLNGIRGEVDRCELAAAVSYFLG